MDGITMDESVEPSADRVISSAVRDMRDTPLSVLIAGSAAQAGSSAIDRVLDLEANGLLTVASFNASL